MVQQTTCCSSPPAPTTPCCYAAGASFGAALTLAAFLLRSRIRRVAVQEPAPDADAEYAREDPRHHQRVLAKARQATCISSAVSYQKAGEVTKAMLELHKALQHNSVCRAPATTMHSPEEVADLYRLHLTTTEHPPNFATLLQLQEMLGMRQDEAARIEVEVLSMPGAFAI